MVTCEPGIYFYPSLLEPAFKDPAQSKFLNQALLENTYMSMGGFRLEDTIIITKDGQVHTAHCTLHNAHGTRHNAHCTLPTAHCTRLFMYAAVHVCVLRLVCFWWCFGPAIAIAGQKTCPPLRARLPRLKHSSLLARRPRLKHSSLLARRPTRFPQRKSKLDTPR